MCMKDLIAELARNGVSVSESQIRWAIKTGKVSRPRLDGSLRFDFDEVNLVELLQHFGAREAVPCA
jgi:hypothetical protein